MSTENTADSVDPQGAAETANREAAQGADASAHATIGCGRRSSADGRTGDSVL